MLQNYFDAVPDYLFEGKNTDTCLIKQLLKIHTSTFPNLEDINIALFGLDDAADEIRTSFYNLNHNFRHINIADLGNLKKQHQNDLHLVVKHLKTKGILPILFGAEAHPQAKSYEAFADAKTLLNLVVVDDKIAYNLNPNTPPPYLNNIIDSPQKKIFHLSVIGYQVHYTDSRVQAHFNTLHFDSIRLGHVRTDLDAAEPLIRDADLMLFNLAALKKIEVPACPDASPSGFFSEDAAQLTYYAGASDKMTGLFIFGFQPNTDNNAQTAKIVAEMIWYFILGYANRQQDYPVSMNNFVEYIVDFKSSNYQIRFWKSTRSDRWWVEVPVQNKSQRRHRLVPCSYQDYLQAAREELPERLLNAYQRFLYRLNP